MRILVSLIIDTLPMLGNVMLLGMLIFTVFGIIGVQIWKGSLRNRCFSNLTTNTSFNSSFSEGLFYEPDDKDFICSSSGNGMTTCNDIPLFQLNNSQFTLCKQSEKNPFKGSISFDNIGYAFIAIFQVFQEANSFKTLIKSNSDEFNSC